jgi:SAM-dependent methyltransferase
MRQFASAAIMTTVRMLKAARRRAVTWRRDAHRVLFPRVPAIVGRAYHVAAARTGLRRYVVPGECRSCPACDSAEIEHLRPLPLFGARAGMTYGFVTGCRRCGVLFANPLPSSSTLQHLYSPEGAWGHPRQAAEETAKAPSVKYLVSMLTPAGSALNVMKPPPGAAVLDFGCGSGEMLDILQDAGWATWGIEPAEKRAFVRHRELAGVPDEPMFDLAIAHHVLEHVPNPLEVLRGLHRALKPDGLVLVSVPRLDTLPEHREFKYCINGRAHILAYTRDAMATLLALAGFSAIDLNPPPGEDPGNWKAHKRLRMLGRRVGGPLPGPADPLAAARTVLDRWDAVSGRGPRGMFGRVRDVRVAAAIADFARRQEKEQRR